MDIHLLPAPIAYVRHLVDVAEDERAKFDQWRVLAQNMLQLMAAILINDCVRLSLIDRLATPPLEKRLVVGDFATFINEAAEALMSKVGLSYVPELVQQYGESSKDTRQRRSRLERIVVNRNRDAHTSSLGQTRELLAELGSHVDEVIEELTYLRAYTLVAAKSVELTPDRSRSLLNGVRCHGVAERYVSIQLPIACAVSRGEVVLIKVDRSDWLSLRPWFLFSFERDGRGPVPAKEELALLNRVNNRRLDYVGLFSGAEYPVDNGWRTFTVYDLERPAEVPVLGAKRDDVQANTIGDVDTDSEKLPESSTYEKLQALSKSHENIVVKEDRGSQGTDYLVAIRTPVREVAVATIDSSGIVRVYPRMLSRAVGDGLLTKAKFDESLRQLGTPLVDEINNGTGLLEIGHISDRLEWVGRLAHEFSQ